MKISNNGNFIKIVKDSIFRLHTRWRDEVGWFMEVGPWSILEMVPIYFNRSYQKTKKS